MTETENESMKTEDAEGKNARARQKLRKAIPTDRVTFSRQLDILRAIALESGRDKKPVSNDAVAKMASLHAGTISVCNPFFLDAGLLLRHKMQNIPCDEVFAYADSYEWDKEKAALKLAPIIRKAWFSLVLIPKLIFRPLPLDEALGLLAEESGATKEHRDQLATILEYMKAAGIISTDGGIVTINKNGDDSASQNDKSAPPPKPSEPPKSKEFAEQEDLPDKEGYLRIIIPLHSMGDGALYLPSDMSAKQRAYAIKITKFLLENYWLDDDTQNAIEELGAGTK